MTRLSQDNEATGSELEGRAKSKTWSSTVFIEGDLNTSPAFILATKTGH